MERLKKGLENAILLRVLVAPACGVTPAAERQGFMVTGAAI